jgi:dTDP-4-dehydrorhamnose reductase
MASVHDASLALWIGPESTVNRVGDRYFDQLEASGFAQRLDDLDLLAATGAQRLRFPLLWERTAPDDLDTLHWAWADQRLERLRAPGLAPIVGLLHHGSGPRYTDLMDPLFPSKLAHYARAVAERYPWVDAYTPINEPVTTARFSGLYGHWYPHRRDTVGFVRMLMSQMRGVVLAMRAIREMNPQATLVQTEDVGYTRSTARLRYQADFDNARRWLSFDLLTGRIDQSHPLWGYLRSGQAQLDELEWFRENACPPDILGVNAYVTSERFLDHRIERYPRAAHGGNGQHAYADVEAARVCGHPIGGPGARLRETYARYALPVAITEAHLGCTREEQMRWLRDAWQAAAAARRDGVDVRAVTVWAAFGSFDWNSLVTRAEGHYEPGLWDVRGERPRAGAMVALCASLARGEPPAHPLLQGPGWWHRRERLLHRAYGRPRGRGARGAAVLITGATGTLGRAFARICAARGIPHRLLCRAELDIADRASVRAALRRWRPWALINAAGYVRVDDAETDSRQWRENAEGPALLAQQCAQRNVALLTFSSDLVFDGEKGAAYVESDAPNPLNAYGAAKRAAEEAALSACPRALVVRTAAFFGPWDAYNFVTQALAQLQQRRAFHAAEDQWVSPTYVPHLVHASLDLLVDGERGVWHLANAGVVSWAELARHAAVMAGLDPLLIEPVSGSALGQRAPRPRFAALGSERGEVMPSLENGLASYLRDRDPALREALDCAAALRGDRAAARAT